jgi:triosephosphate isomerase (TIM)
MKTIIGNWKMHLGIRESVALARGIVRNLRGQENLPEIVLCPSHTSLSEVRKVLTRSRISLGAQNCGHEKSGALTGEISVGMLEDVRADYVIIGHSERRTLLAETDEVVRAKLKLAMESKLQPVLCIGEPREVRENGEAESYLEAQLDAALTDLTVKRGKNVIIAYEPIWAISTTKNAKNASVADIIEMHSFIREAVRARVHIGAERIKVLFGGSVNGDNAYEILREGEVNGVLVGGASLKLQQFSAILGAAIDVVVAQSK